MTKATTVDMRILIAEDEPICALSALCELRHAGHETLGPAGTVQEALQLARMSRRPHLALVDIDLAERGDGLELARQLQQMSIAIVFISARVRTACSHSDLALGLICKPYNPADLPPSIEAIDCLLRGCMPQPLQVPHSLQLFCANH